MQSFCIDLFVPTCFCTGIFVRDASTVWRWYAGVFFLACVRLLLLHMPAMLQQEPIFLCILSRTCTRTHPYTHKCKSADSDIPVSIFRWRAYTTLTRGSTHRRAAAHCGRGCGEGQRRTARYAVPQEPILCRWVSVKRAQAADPCPIPPCCGLYSLFIFLFLSRPHSLPSSSLTASRSSCMTSPV